MRFKAVDGLLYAAMKIAKMLDKRQTGIEHLDPEKIRNILVVSSTAIGDTLLSTPAIRAVRERFPQAGIIAHFNSKNMKLFDNNPHIDGIIPYYGGYKKFCRTVSEFREHEFDLALIFHGNEPQATPMAYLSGAKFIIKLPATNEYRFLLSNDNAASRNFSFTHGVEQRLKVAELAGCSISDKRMVLVEREDGTRYLDGFLKENGINNGDILIGFQPGASTISRMWFAERFIELGRRLITAHPGLKIIITGSPQEQDLCKRIAEGLGEGAIVTAGRIPLQYMPSLIKKVRVLVTGDTGIMHLAIAAGTLVVALFAVSDPKISGPYYDLDRHLVIKKAKTCDPCASKKCTYQKCLEQISVQEVYDAVLTRINYQPGGAE